MKWWTRYSPFLLIIAAGLGVYANSFAGPFIFDDIHSIVENPSLRHLWPLGKLLARTTRPLVDLSLALNYAWGRLDVRGYHAVNLAIHLAASLTLFGILRQALRSERMRVADGETVRWLPLAMTLLWLVHPLQTESVTYLIQRAEALAGFFSLLTLYCAIRGAVGPHRRGWDAAAILSCACGIASKATAVTVPLLILLYDRVFVFPSFRQAIRPRAWLYGGLAATWGLLAVLLATTPHLAEKVGWGARGLTPLAYAATQPAVVLHYLTLAVWPARLCLDYGWLLATTAAEIWPPAVLIAILLLAATLWAFRYRPRLGFLGAWFFLTLAPSSSVIPLADLAVEHRMYLPLAAVITLVVLAGERLLRVLIASSRVRTVVAATLLIGLVAALGARTIRRNGDYRSEVSIWRDAIVQRPTSARAHTNLCEALTRQGRLQEAIAQCAEALTIRPDSIEAHLNLGVALARDGHPDAAIPHYQEALRLAPASPKAHTDLATALLQQGKLQDAKAHLITALRWQPEFAEAHYNLGNAFADEGRLTDAMAQYAEALRLNPLLADAQNNWGNVLVLQGERDAALAHYAEALRIDPSHPKARHNVQRVSQADPP